jgi:hypothetical protein
MQAGATAMDQIFGADPAELDLGESEDSDPDEETDSEA